TNFTFRMQPTATVSAGPMFWALEDAPDVMRRYEDYITDAPGEINGFFAFLTVPPVPMFPENLHMKKVCGVIWCSTADMDHTNKLLSPTSSWPKPLLSAVGP